MERNQSTQNNTLKLRIKGNDSLSQVILSKTSKGPNIILSDFKREVGEIADVLSFQREFLGRETLSDLQKECYIAAWGETGGVWSQQYQELVLLVGLKGGKNYFCEGDIAYACYFISCLKDPHGYFSRITKRSIRYTPEANFDIVCVSLMGGDHAQNVLFRSASKVLRSAKDPKTGEYWFKKFTGLDNEIRSGGYTKEAVIFPNKYYGKGGIRLMSFSSRPSAPEGYHILRFYADELAQLGTKAKYKTAMQMNDLAVFNTAISFPCNVGKAIFLGYPNGSKRDFIVEKYEDSKKFDFMYGMKASTFDFNPTITPEDIIRQGYTDPKKWNRVYECEYKINS